MRYREANSPRLERNRNYVLDVLHPEPRYALAEGSGQSTASEELLVKRGSACAGGSACADRRTLINSYNRSQHCQVAHMSRQIGFAIAVLILAGADVW